MESGNVIRAIKAAIDGGFSIVFNPDDRDSLEMLLLDRKDGRFRTFNITPDLLKDEAFDADRFYARKIEQHVTGMTAQRA